MIKFICVVLNPYEAKYLFLFNKREGSELKHFNGSKAIIDYSNDNV